MSGVDFLDKLLDGVEVEWKPLSEVLVRTKGTKITAGQMKRLHKDDGMVKIFAGGRTVAFVNLEDIPAKDINRKPSIIVKSRGVMEFEYYDKPFSHKNEMWSYHSKSDHFHIKFFYHYLKLNEPYFQQLGSKMQMPQIATPDTDKFLVPIPCPDNPKKSLEIQAEIVRILDAFTELIAELTAELTARKKQYNYYRDQLLSFEDVEVEWKALGDERFFEIANSGRTPVKASLRQPGEIPYYGANNIQDYVDGHTHDGVFVLIAEDGSASLENYSIQYAEGKFWANNHVHVVRGTKAVNTRFLYHYLSIVNFIPFLTGGGRAKLTKGSMVEIQIPIPCPDNPKKSLAEQARIVFTLDKFDALTNSLTEGLPREIELRQKQYEYYRDLLLGFPILQAIEA